MTAPSSTARARSVVRGSTLAASWSTWKKPRSCATAAASASAAAANVSHGSPSASRPASARAAARRGRRRSPRAGPPSSGSGGRSCPRPRPPRGRRRRRPTPSPCSANTVRRGVEDAAAVALGVGAQRVAARRSSRATVYTKRNDPFRFLLPSESPASATTTVHGKPAAPRPRLAAARGVRLRPRADARRARASPRSPASSTTTPSASAWVLTGFLLSASVVHAARRQARRPVRQGARPVDHARLFSARRRSSARSRRRSSVAHRRARHHGRRRRRLPARVRDHQRRVPGRAPRRRDRPRCRRCSASAAASACRSSGVIVDNARHLVALLDRRSSRCPPRSPCCAARARRRRARERTQHRLGAAPRSSRSAWRAPARHHQGQHAGAGARPRPSALPRSAASRCSSLFVAARAARARSRSSTCACSPSARCSP